MPGRTPPEAVSNYVEPVQRAVSCVSDSVVSVDGGYYVSDTPHILTLNRGFQSGLVERLGSGCPFNNTTASSKPNFQTIPGR